MDIAVASAAPRQDGALRTASTSKPCWDWLYEMRQPTGEELSLCQAAGPGQGRLLQALLDPNRTAELPALHRDMLAAQDLEAACAANVGGLLAVFEAGRNFADSEPWLDSATDTHSPDGNASALGRGALILHTAIVRMLGNGDLLETSAHLARLATVAEEADSDALRILGAAVCAYRDLMSGRLLVAKAVISDALHLSPQPDAHPIPKMHLQASFGLLNTVRGLAGAARERLATLVEHDRFDQLPGHLWLMCMGHRLLSLAASGSPGDEIDACAERLRSRSVPEHNFYYRSYLHYSLGAAALLTDQPETALFHAQSASILGRRCGSAMAERTAAMLVIQALNDLGHHEEALSLMVDQVRPWREAGAHLLVATAAMEEASILLQRGDTANAREAMRHARAVLPPGEDLPHNLRSNRFVTDLVARLEPGADHPNTPPEDPHPVQITTFGELRVEINGKVIYDRDWRGARGKTLLKALIVLGGHKVAAERLADLLWPDADGDVARNNLKVALWRLRRLGCHKDETPLPWIAVQHGHVSLVASLCRVDCMNFQNELRAAMASGFPEPIHMALAHCVGDFLGSDDSESWVVEQRNTLRQQYVLGACALADAVLRRPSHVDPAPALEAALRLAPDDIRCQRLLAQARSRPM